MEEEKGKKYTSRSGLLPPEEFMLALNSLVQTVKIHQANNRLVIDGIRRFVELSALLIGAGDYLTLQISHGVFYIQEEKVPARRATGQLLGRMLDYFEKRELLGLRIYATIRVAPQEKIIAFARLMNQATEQKNPMDWLVLQLEAAKIEWLAIIQPEAPGVTGYSESASVWGTFDGGPGGGGSATSGASGSAPGGGGTGGGTGGGSGGGAGGSGSGTAGSVGGAGGVLAASAGGGAGGGAAPGGEGSGGGTGGPGGGGDMDGPLSEEAVGYLAARKVYSYAMASMRDVPRKISINQRTGIRKAVRVVQTMVEDVILQDKPMLLAMSTIKVYDDYTFCHSVNVSILAMYLGKELGLSRESLEMLGVCGLFHDLGKVLVPQRILKKPGRLDPDEYEEIKQHSLNSVRLIVKLRASSKRKARILLAPFEHHLRYNRSGYPEVNWRRPISLFGRILAVADVYDALTSPRIYREEAMPADRALGIMLEQSGDYFDPIILKVFINMLGVYPIGTVLELDDGQIGVVCSTPSAAAVDRPRLIMLVPDGRGGFLKGTTLDLTGCDPNTGSFVRAVKRSYNPATLGIQPAQFISS